MLDLLRDPVWVGIGVVVTVALYLRDRRGKRLSWRVVAHATLTTNVLPEDLVSRVQILLDGQLVGGEALRAVDICVTNTGSGAIGKDVYISPVTFDFGPDARVLAAMVAATSPGVVGASAVAHETTATLDPVLLNGRQSVTVKMLVVGGRPPTVRAQIMDGAIRASLVGGPLGAIMEAIGPVLIGFAVCLTLLYVAEPMMIRSLLMPLWPLGWAAFIFGMWLIGQLGMDRVRRLQRERRL